MPIKDHSKYPRDWASIREEVLNRAGHRCEGTPQHPDCRVRNYAEHPDTGPTVVLTIAHMDHDTTNNGEEGDRPNLRALCQRCHLSWDAKHHARNAAQTRRLAKANIEMNF